MLFESQKKFEYLRDNVLLKHIDQEFLDDFGGPDKLLDRILAYDPTRGNKPAGKYGDWLVRSWLALEEGERIEVTLDTSSTNILRGALRAFDKAKSKLPEPDINKAFPPRPGVWNELIQEMSHIQSFGWDLPNLERVLKKETTVVWQNESWQVVIPETFEAAKYWGKHTSWCTSADSEQGQDQYDQYTKYGDNPLFIITTRGHKRGDDKMQLDFNKPEFVDGNGRTVFTSDLRNFLAEVGVPADAFRAHVGGEPETLTNIAHIYEDQAALDELLPTVKYREEWTQEYLSLLLRGIMPKGKHVWNIGKDWLHANKNYVRIKFESQLALADYDDDITPYVERFDAHTIDDVDQATADAFNALDLTSKIEILEDANTVIDFTDSIYEWSKACGMVPDVIDSIYFIHIDIKMSQEQLTKYGSLMFEKWGSFDIPVMPAKFLDLAEFKIRVPRKFVDKVKDLQTESTRFVDLW